MVYASEDEGDPHPFWYARVLHVFHVNIISAPTADFRARCGYRGRMDIMWVRWFGRDLLSPAGWKACKLDTIGYIEPSPRSAQSFGFLDPELIVRACHLIPAYKYGFTKHFIPQSSHWDDAAKGDWRFYYVMRYVLHRLSMLNSSWWLNLNTIPRFVDRDILMRYVGGGIGHLSDGLHPELADLAKVADDGDDSVSWDGEFDEDEDESDSEGDGELEDDDQDSQDEDEDEEDDGAGDDE